MIHSRSSLARLFALLTLCLAGSALIAVEAPLRFDPDSIRDHQQDLYRLYDGITAYVVNEDGESIDLTLDVRDLNIFEAGPREVLFKVYGPDGETLVREVIPDDGIASRNYLPRFGGWDHEMWYYGLQWTRGSEPMLRWSAVTEPDRVGAVPVRSFQRTLPAGAPGIYRVMVVGSRDHLVTLRMNPRLPYAISGHPSWLHGHGEQLREGYFYVPRGVNRLRLGFAEFDQPQTRTFTLRAPDGSVLFEGSAQGGFTQSLIRLEEAGQYDDEVLKLEVSEGEGDFMVHLLLDAPDRNPNGPGSPLRGGGGGSAAVFADNPETARAVKGGAIYHDGEVFWHHFQIRLHEWLKARDPEDFIVRNAGGEVVEPVYGRQYGARSHLRGLPMRDGFVPLNGVHEPPPLSDSIMFDYPAFGPNPEAINVAIADLHDGLRHVGTGDHRFASGWNGNFGYMFATYGFHYWRPAWRMMHEPDVPEEVKEILMEALLVMGDRLAFGRNIERANGNAFSHMPIALRYVAAATGDPLHQELFEVYFDRWANEGWGEGTGISPSGTGQEHFAHAYHYGTYIIANLRAVLSDFDEPQFREVLDRVLNFYSYVWAPEAAANVWSARTGQGIGEPAPWKGRGGPDLTVSVNDGDEWFAARRSNYYIVTFHGRLAPMWLNNYFGSRLGYGGGGLTQFAVPGRGPVLVSTLNGNYGEGMQPRNWRNFRIHSVVGEMADGLPLVAADSEHLNARLEGNVVTSSGEVRDSPVHARRRYEFGPDGVEVGVELARTLYHEAMWGMGRDSRVIEAHEMIPFIHWKSGANPRRLGEEDHTLVSAIDAGGNAIELTGEAIQEVARVRIDRGGFGVDIVFEEPRTVRRGANHAVMVELVARDESAAPTPVEGLLLQYRLVPFGSD